MYTGTQHAFISEKVAIDAAQIWLGIIEDQFGLLSKSSSALRAPRLARRRIIALMRAGSNTHRMLARSSAIAAAIGLAVSTAPAADADENDEAFLKALFHHDIRPTGHRWLCTGRIGRVTN